MQQEAPRLGRNEVQRGEDHVLKEKLTWAASTEQLQNGRPDNRAGGFGRPFLSWSRLFEQNLCLDKWSVCRS